MCVVTFTGVDAGNFIDSKIPNLISHEASCHNSERRGLDGLLGPIGATGATGAQGGAGPQGNLGPRGETGPTGDVGPFGNQGSEGAIGASGPTGTQGVVGFTGPLGYTGNTGRLGFTGYTGFTGGAGEAGQILGYAQYYSTAVLSNIASGSIVSLNVLTFQSGGFSLSGSSAVVPADGFYQIRYTVSVSEVASVILVGNVTGVIDSSATGTIRTDGNIFGNVIVALRGGETVSIRNNGTGTFSTQRQIPAQNTVSMTIVWLR